MPKFNVRSLVVSALMIALGVLLPITLHAVPNAGSILLPMHIPVFIGGLACGLPYGLAVGVLTPILSTLATGMPPAAMLPAMVCELAVYGAVSGLFIRLIRGETPYLPVYTALISSMLVGRVVYGILNALIFRAGNYSMQVWLTSVFVTSLPGIVIQLVLVPAVVFALYRAKVIRPLTQAA